jgi:mono/diheme cytochrome c family protein
MEALIRSRSTITDRASLMLAASMAAVCLMPGCSRRTEVAYSPREEIAKLPEKHQRQIAGFLEDYFGSPATPRFLLPASTLPASALPTTMVSTDGATPDESATDEAATDGADAPPRLVDHPDWNRTKLRQGADVYRRQCASCHGVTGDGQGPAGQYLNPPPRDYRLGRFKFTSTPRGEKPRYEDLARILRRGAKGTSMPSFRWLPDDELDAVIGYVMLLSSRGEMELLLLREAESELEEADDLNAEVVAGYATRVYESWRDAAGKVVNPATTEPLASDDTVRAGAKAFIELNCFKCHGKDGRGNKAFNVGKDDWGHTAYAADLTSGMLHGGRRPVDIYRRIYLGINGTPMPAFDQPDTTKGETAEQRSETIWHLVHFVTSIVEGKPLPVDVIEETLRSLPNPGADSATDAPAESTEKGN